MPPTHRFARRSGRIRGLLLVILVVVVLLAALVVLTPTLVSMGLGQGLVRGAVAKQVNGDVSFDGLRLRWLGEQSIEGLRIVEPGGRTAVDADVTLDRGLLHLVRGAIAPLTVRVSGDLDGAIESDGSLSFTKLLRESDDVADDDAGGLPEAGPIEVVVERSSLHLRDERFDREVTLEDIDGALEYAPGDRVDVRLTAATVTDGVDGRIEVTGRTIGLVDERGRLTPDGASLQLDATVESVPLIVAEVDTVIRSLRLNVSADDLARELILMVSGEASVESEPPSTLQGQFAVAAPFDATGAFTPAFDGTTGTLEGRRVPTAVLRPFLANASLGALSALDPERDLGRTVDIEAAVLEELDGAFRLAIEGERVQATLSGRLGADRIVELDSSRVSATVQPGLVAAASTYRIDGPVGATLALDGARIPMDGDGGSLRLAELAMTGVLTVDGPVMLSTADGQPPLGSIEGLELRAETGRLADGLTITGRGRVASADVEIDERITNIVDEAGALQVASARPVGRVQVTGLPAALVDRFLSAGEAPADAGTSDDPREGMLASMDVTAIDATIETSLRGSDLAADVGARLASTEGDLRLTASAVERRDAVAVESATVEGTVTPGLLAAFQAGADQPIVLARPTPVTITVEPFVVPGSRAAGFAAPAEPVAGRVRSETFSLANVPGMAAPITAAGLDLAVTMLPGETTRWRANGGASVSNGPIYLGALNADVTVPGDGAAPLTGELRLAEASIEAWENQLGREPDSLRRWLGARGAVTVDVQSQGEGYRATLRPELPTLSGVFAADVVGDVVDVSSQDATLTMRRRLLQELFGGATAAGDEPDDGDAPARGRRVRTPTALELAVAVDRCRLPMALLRGEPFEPSAVQVDVGLTGGPLELVYPNGTTAALRDIDARVRTVDLRAGVELRVDARTEATAAGAGGSEAAGSQAGTVAARGRLENVLDADGAVAFGDGRLQLDLTAEAFPTAVIDALASFDGLAVAALGPRLSATAKADDFSGSGGTLEASMLSESASLTAALRGGEESLWSIEDRPLEAELQPTPALRERLLARLHPIFADIQTIEQPLRLTASGLRVPIDGEVGSLNGDVRLSVGAVKLAGGSLLLGLLKLFDEEPDGTIDGYIEPVVATIRDGVVRYERFAVKLDKYTLNYSGSINLLTKQIDLRTEVPLEALAMTFNELEGYADKITVPIVTTGSFEQYVTKVDPKFNLGEQAAAAGFQGALGELGKKLEEQGVPFNDILGNIFGGKKKKDDGGGG